ncbi:putative pyridoxal phosphate-dependent aminotransferase EpsN [Posidoniimonas polymericola]|uniref:Putative pyridoxal phosphate-dependent aminotransferase EpsN n=1 Tax=Posidoniimonas polymericola TaxID=2528002 RepID=A0A5C5YSP3_9BACT|nr:DegT/DnrJ/EryC1/StrS family aminotransferase [Posidoniimonas polymericola]TWT77780.1 putative pyridoxal phosphate-dependent aminotransferase EpsN [Posidoniimonas polymericola]
MNAPSPERILLSPPHMSGGERELLLDAFDSNWIAPLGPHVDALEREVCERVGTEAAVALATGTAALHLALLTHGVGPGDEVLCSTLTFAATANAIRYCGAKPVFVDSDLASWNMDPDLLEAELKRMAAAGARPAAVLTVDAFGQCADYERIEPLCERFATPLIVDAAESLGATCGDRHAGTQGRCGVYSLNGNKIITASGGGVLVTSDPGLAERIRHLATQAKLPAPHYEHEEIGFNYRMSNLLAAVARGQLAVLDERVAARRANFDSYRRALSDLPGVSFMPEAPYGASTRWLTCMQIDPAAAGVDQTAVRETLARQSIESRPLWKPMHLQPVHQDCRRVGGRVSQTLFETGLCLPSGSALTDRQLDRVAKAVRDAFSLAGHRAA